MRGAASRQAARGMHGQFAANASITDWRGHGYATRPQGRRAARWGQGGTGVEAACRKDPHYRTWYEMVVRAAGVARDIDFIHLL